MLCSGDRLLDADRYKKKHTTPSQHRNLSSKISRFIIELL